MIYPKERVIHNDLQLSLEQFLSLRSGEKFIINNSEGLWPRTVYTVVRHDVENHRTYYGMSQFDRWSHIDLGLMPNTAGAWNPCYYVLPYTEEFEESPEPGVIASLYRRGECPDCGEPIPKDAKWDEACSTFGIIHFQ